MLHDVRDTTATYRVVKVGDTYSVTKFPAEVTDVEAVDTCMYREDMVPRWILERVKMLNVSGEVSVTINMYGQKHDDSYWFFSDEHYKLAVEMKISGLLLWQIMNEEK